MTQLPAAVPSGRCRARARPQGLPTRAAPAPRRPRWRRRTLCQPQQRKRAARSTAPAASARPPARRGRARRCWQARRSGPGQGAPTRCRSRRAGPRPRRRAPARPGRPRARRPPAPAGGGAGTATRPAPRPAPRASRRPARPPRGPPPAARLARPALGHKPRTACAVANQICA